MQLYESFTEEASYFKEVTRFYQILGDCKTFKPTTLFTRLSKSILC